MKNILIGSAGTGNAFSTVLALRKKYSTNCRIILTDTNPSHLVTANLFADDFYQIAAYTDPAFENSILQIIAKHNIDTYFPFIDAEVSIAAKLYEEGKLPESIKLQVKNSVTATICNDKFKAYKFLKQQGITTPETFLLENEIQPSLNEFIVKPRNGFGSSIKKITQKDISSLENKAAYVGQEICELPEVTVDVSYSVKHNHFFCLCRERIQTKAGVCTKALIFQDTELSEMAFNLSKLLNLHSFCFQVMKFNNRWAITDINPRLGAGSSMANAAGFDFFLAMLYIMESENPQSCFPKFEKEFFVTRQYVDYLM